LLACAHEAISSRSAPVISASRRTKRAAYFNGVLGLGLTAPDVAALESRTEGWIAALHLAGLSMQGRDDPAGFIASFAGDDRYIVDYLVEEVLQRQTERVRTFLAADIDPQPPEWIAVRCSHRPGRRQGDARGPRATETSAHPARTNRRDWYRYHHLFADVLQARLRDEQPELVGELHRRATEWFEQNGERAEAIRHAWQPRTSREPRTSSSWRFRTQPESDRRRPSANGLKRCQTT
jgi:LuxR family maltose regulon positive regulatory protein